MTEVAYQQVTLKNVLRFKKETFVDIWLQAMKIILQT